MASNRIYTDRSRNLDHARCPRLRFLGYHAGSAERGVQPVKKSIHLVLGGAVHTGLEVLLRESQSALNEWAEEGLRDDLIPKEINGRIEALFVTSLVWKRDGKTVARDIEDSAVAAALADLAAATLHGIELDENEKPDSNPSAGGAGSAAIAGLGTAGGTERGILDSPLVIDFGEFDAATGKFIDSPTTEGVGTKLDMDTSGGISTPADWSTPIYTSTGFAGVDISTELALDTRLDEIEVANAQAATGMDDYLKEELAAQVEGMVRAYARRRLRPLLEEFEVLEVEREGEWRLGAVDITIDEVTDIGTETRFERQEIYFMSRLDALLLNRQTNQLYLQSYKTTGNWDRRKEAEAQIDMQGLTESVDVDNRLAQAHELIHDAGPQSTYSTSHLVNEKVRQWLRAQPEPPRILGVRYEYLIKGPRRQDSKDPAMPGRYVADTPLIRAYMQDGITDSDRKWAANYQIWVNGKQRNLDYRSYRKHPVWKFMSIAKWIDMLDKGEVQPEAHDKQGNVIDVLADQFVTPIHVYRNEDDLRDMLEQLEAEEVRIAENVSRVLNSPTSERRSLLNQLFPQNRRSCVYPGRCSGYEICYGSAEMRANPEHSDLYQIRVPNHPQELSGKKSEVVVATS